MKIAIGNDFAGSDLKQHMKLCLSKKGFDVTDFGDYDSERIKVLEKEIQDVISKNECEMGIIICVDSLQSSKAVKPVSDIHCIIYSNQDVSENDSNSILELGTRTIGTASVESVTTSFLMSQFDNANLMIYDPNNNNLQVNNINQVVQYDKVEVLIDKIKDTRASYNMPAGQDTVLAGVKNVRYISFLTGQMSENRTQERFEMFGADVGIPVQMGNKMYYLFGDSFYNETSNEWINNCLAWSDDLDYRDGLRLDNIKYEDFGGKRRIAPLFPGKRVWGKEFSNIPTGAISIGNTLYASYMVVREWGPADIWTCTYGSVAKSTDEGFDWKLMDNLRWPGDKFGLMFPYVHGEWVYIWGTPGGRLDPARLMRVPVAEYENFDAYSYYTGTDASGAPIFEKGEAGLANSAVVIPGKVGEISAMYSEYLGEWMVTYTSGMNVVMRTAKNPWGPYTEPMVIVSSGDFSIDGIDGRYFMRLYCANLHPTFTSEGGRKVGFLLSHYSPVYNVMLMEMELVKKTK